MIEIYDADTLVYRVGFATEKKTYTAVTSSGNVLAQFDNKKAYNKIKESLGEHELWTEHIVEPLSHALHSLNLTIGAIHARLQGSKQHFVLSGKGNYRNDFATVRPYKGNRDPTHKPVYYNDLRGYLVEKYKAEVVDGAEADDYIGILASKDPDNSIIITNDKDLRQIEGWHYDWTKENAKPFMATPESSTEYFYLQLAMGDPVDNIPGIEGMAEAGARRLLKGANGPSDMENRVLNAYRAKYGKEEGDRRFIETGTLVKICRKNEEIGQPWRPSISMD